MSKLQRRDCKYSNVWKPSISPLSWGKQYVMLKYTNYCSLPPLCSDNYNLQLTISNPLETVCFVYIYAVVLMCVQRQNTAVAFYFWCLIKCNYCTIRLLVRFEAVKITGTRINLHKIAKFNGSKIYRFYSNCSLICSHRSLDNAFVLRSQLLVLSHHITTTVFIH